MKPSYFCATYNEHGKENPTDCRCHKVRHEALEPFVLDWLRSNTPQVAELLRSIDSGHFTEPRDWGADPETEMLSILSDPLIELGRAYSDLEFDLVEFVEDHEDGVRDSLRGCKSLLDIYGVVHSQLTPKWEQSLADKEAELDQMMDDFRTLTPRLRDRANQRMEALADEIDALKRQLEDLRVPLASVREELQTLHEAMEAAQSTIADRQTGSRKHHEISKVVGRIECKFRYTDKKSFLESVAISPVEKVINGASPEPG